MNVYERFTDRARGVVILADLACRELGQREVGTEHLLLGMTQEVGTAHHVLRAMDVTADKVRKTIVDLFGRDLTTTASPGADAGDGGDGSDLGGRVDGEVDREVEVGAAAADDAEAERDVARPAEPVDAIDLTDAKLAYAPEAHVALETALRESLGLRQHHVGTEHLLLGLLRNNDSRGVRVLRHLRVDPDSVRERVLDLLATPGFVSPEMLPQGTHHIVSTGSGPAPATGMVDGVDVRRLADEVVRLRAEVLELRAIVERLEQKQR